MEIPFTGHQDLVLHWTNRAEYYRHGRSEGLLGELLMTGPAKASRQGSPERRDLSSTSGYLDRRFTRPFSFSFPYEPPPPKSRRLCCLRLDIICKRVSATLSPRQQTFPIFPFEKFELTALSLRVYLHTHSLCEWVSEWNNSTVSPLVHSYL